MFKPLQHRFPLNLYFSKTELERLLILSCLFSLGLTVLRILHTGHWRFLSMCWNLFLALVPYWLTRFALRNLSWVEQRPKFALLFGAWLLFLPNSFYIITDLFHLQINAGVPLWFDLALLFSFAWNGLLLGVLSVRVMEKLVTLNYPAVKEWQFVYPLMLLNAFGLYLGRYLRYNSWDVVANPFQLAQDIVYLLLHPLRYRLDWSMIGCYAVFMSLIYLGLKRVSKALW